MKLCRRWGKTVSIQRTWRKTHSSKGEISYSGCDPSYLGTHLGMVDFGALVGAPVVRVPLWQRGSSFSWGF